MNYTTLQVSGVKVRLISEEESRRLKSPRLRAVARVALSDQLQLNGLRVYDGENGLFVYYPSEPPVESSTCFHQLYFPLVSALRAAIEKAVLSLYLKGGGKDGDVL